MCDASIPATLRDTASGSALESGYFQWSAFMTEWMVSPVFAEASRISWANRLQTDGRTSRCTKDSGCTGILPAGNLTHSATLASAFLANTL